MEAGPLEEGETLVPSHMKTVLLVLFLEISLVTSEIVIPGAIFSYLGDGMKWLMNVTHIVNEEAEGDGSGCVEIIIR